MPATAEKQTSRRAPQAFETFDAKAVDQQTGHLDGVALITGNTEALGHGSFIDEQTVRGLAAMLLGKSLPAYVTHEGAIFGDRLTTEVGYWSGIHLDGDKLRGNFRFLRSFEQHEPAKRDKLVDLATTMPEHFGVSLVGQVELVWATPDGDVPYYRGTPRPENALHELPSVRFTEAQSADFVKQPAANPDGLYSEETAPDVDATGHEQMDTPDENTDPAALEAFQSQITRLEAEESALVEKVDDLTGQVKTLTADLEASRTAYKTLEETTRAKISELEAKLKEAEAFSAAHLGVDTPVEMRDEDESPTITAANFWEHYNALPPGPQRTAFYRQHASLARTAPALRRSKL